MEFYVYAYLRRNKKPYYIGKGKGKRAYSKCRAIPRPTDLSRIVFLRANLSEEESFHWETFYIKRYGRIDNGTGILRNLTDGGEGTSNPCEKVRKIRSTVAKKVLDPAFEKSVNNPSHPSYGKGGKAGGKRACDPNNPRGVNNPNHPSYKARNKRSGERALKNQGKRVRMTNLETGEVKEYPSIRSAARDLGLLQGTLTNLLNPDHPSKTYKGFIGEKL